MITQEVWIGRSHGSIELFDGKMSKPQQTNGWFDKDPIFDFCELGWRQVFGLLGLRKKAVKRFRITIEEIK